MSVLKGILEQDTKTKALGAFCIIHGLVSMYVSPFFTGRADPFDSAFPLYAPLPALFICGLLIGHFRMYPIVCIYLGEGAYPILKGSNLWPLSLIVMPFYLAPGALAFLAILTLKVRLFGGGRVAEAPAGGQADLESLREKGHW